MSNQETEYQSFHELQEIKKAIQPYIGSAKSGNADQGLSAFYDHALIVGAVGGNFSVGTTAQFKQAFSQMGASPDVQSEIAWIDISGPAAVAKVEFYNWQGFRFTDYLSLFKHENQWKVSGKVFDAHSKN